MGGGRGGFRRSRNPPAGIARGFLHQCGDATRRASREKTAGGGGGNRVGAPRRGPAGTLRVPFGRRPGIHQHRPFRGVLEGSPCGRPGKGAPVRRLEGRRGEERPPRVRVGKPDRTSSRRSRSRRRRRGRPRQDPRVHRPQGRPRVLHQRRRQPDGQPRALALREIPGSAGSTWSSSRGISATR
jgi:hypothetical protein